MKAVNVLDMSSTSWFFFAETWKLAECPARLPRTRPCRRLLLRNNDIDVEAVRSPGKSNDATMRRRLTIRRNQWFVPNWRLKEIFFVKTHVFDQLFISFGWTAEQFVKVSGQRTGKALVARQKTLAEQHYMQFLHTVCRPHHCIWFVGFAHSWNEKHEESMNFWETNSERRTHENGEKVATLREEFSVLSWKWWALGEIQWQLFCIEECRGDTTRRGGGGGTFFSYF